MSWLLCGEDEAVKNWIIDKIDYVYRLDSCVCVGVMSGNRMIAGIAYHGYQPEYSTIQVSMAAISPMWAKRHIVKKLLEYPFEQLDCYKIMISVKAINLKALKTSRHAGFEHEAVLRHFYGKDQHGVILQILKPYYNRMFGENNGR